MRNLDNIKQHWSQKRMGYLDSVLEVAKNFMIEYDLQLEFTNHEVELSGAFAFILEEAVKDLLHDLQHEMVDLEDISIDEDNPYEGDFNNFISDLSWRLIEELEHILAERDHYIPDSNRDGDEDEACIFGDVYYALEEEFKKEAWDILHDFIKIVNS